MKCCKNCGWLSVNPGGAMFCGYSDERTWENESCRAWKDKDKPQTNYDKLISKSPEELAAWISKIADCCGNDYCGKSCPLHTLCWSKSNESTLDWLKQPVEEEGET